LDSGGVGVRQISKYFDDYAVFLDLPAVAVFAVLAWPVASRLFPGLPFSDHTFPTIWPVAQLLPLVYSTPHGHAGPWASRRISGACSITCPGVSTTAPPVDID